MEYQIVTINNIEYDFTPYPIEYCVNERELQYYGFIGPDGEYYKVRDICAPAYERPHNTWARNFINYKGLISHQTNTTSSMKLVKEFGFILCTDSPEDSYNDGVRFITPEKDAVLTIESCLQILTNEKQRETIKFLQELNTKTRGR